MANLCLDFINTVPWRGDMMVRHDEIDGYGRLLEWADARAVLHPDDLETLREEAAADTELRRRALGRAWALRRALHDCLRAAVSRETPPAGSVSLLNHAISELGAGPRLTIGAQGLALELPASRSPDLLRPILVSALRLLGSTDLACLRECAGEECGRLFLDGTKNQSRRWCDMATCGNRAKARRFQMKRREGVKT